MADTMIFDEAGADLRRCRAERDALAKRVEELEELVARLKTYRDTDDYEEAYEAIHDEACRIAERRAGRAAPPHRRALGCRAIAARLDGKRAANGIGGVACGRPESEHCEKKEIGSYWCGLSCKKAHHDFEPPEEVEP